MSHRVYISASTQKENVGVGSYGTEQDRMQYLADRVKYWLDTQKGMFVVFRNHKDWTLAQTVEDCNKLACELFIDNHTDAGPSLAEGTTGFFHTGSVKGKLLADTVYKYIAPLSPGKDRKVQVDTTLYKSGLYVLRNTNPPAMLIEHLFHSNIKEALDMITNADKYAKAEAQALCEYCGEKWIEVIAQTTVISPAVSEMSINDAIDIWAKAGVILDSIGMKNDFSAGEFRPDRYLAFMLKSAKYIKEKAK